MRFIDVATNREWLDALVDCAVDESSREAIERERKWESEESRLDWEADEMV